MYLLELVFLFFPDINPGVDMLDHRIVCFSFAMHLSFFAFQIHHIIDIIQYLSFSDNIEY